MISHMFHIPHGDVEDRPLSEYHELREQAFNIMGCIRGGELSLQIPKDEKKSIEAELDVVKARGGLDHAKELLRKYGKKNA